MSNNISLSCTNSLVTIIVVINHRNISRGPRCLQNLHTKIFVGISANVGIGCAESRPKFGTRWGSIGRAEILGRFLGYCWSTKFLLHVQKLILGVSFGHSWRFSKPPYLLSSHYALDAPSFAATDAQGCRRQKPSSIKWRRLGCGNGTRRRQ